MKTTILSIFILFSVVAPAQIHKGVSFMSGRISGMSTKYETTTINQSTNKYNDVGLEIMYGNYFSGKFAWGLAAGFEYLKYKSETDNSGSTSTSEQINLTYSVRPNLRYTKPVSEKFYCSLNFYVEFASGPQKTRNSNQFTAETSYTSKYSSFGGGITGSLNYFLGEHFALGITYGNIGYESATTERDDTDSKTTSGGLTLNAGLTSIGIGLDYYFGGDAKK